MSWLTRMEIDAESAFATGAMDSYQWHRRLWQCFPGEPDRNARFLTRVDTFQGAFRLWVLSPTRPARPRGVSPPDGFALREISPSFLSHPYYVFDLRVNPVKCLVQRDAATESGKIATAGGVPLVKPEDLRAWLDRKGCEGGFRILSERPLEIGPVVRAHFRKRHDAACHGGVQFRGLLEVTDREQFTKTYYAGVGTAQGLWLRRSLLLAPANL